MGAIAKQKLAMAYSLRIYGGSFSHFFCYLLIKHNVGEVFSKYNIWGTFYMPKGNASGGGKMIIKYYVMENIYINTNPQEKCRNV